MRYHSNQQPVPWQPIDTKLNYLVLLEDSLKLGERIIHLYQKLSKLCINIGNFWNTPRICGERPSSGRRTSSLDPRSSGYGSFSDGGPSRRMMDDKLSRFRADHVYFSTLPLFIHFLIDHPRPITRMSLDWRQPVM